LTVGNTLLLKKIKLFPEKNKYRGKSSLKETKSGFLTLELSRQSSFGFSRSAQKKIKHA
jgi:hypothetical protein